MVKCLFNLFIVVACLVIIVLCVVGCGAPITANNPFGINDPNQAQGWINLGVAIGRGVQTTGMATGNPMMIAYGAMLILTGGTAAQILFGNKKKEGEDSGTT